MIVYFNKFQAIVLQKGSKNKNTNNKSSIKNITINATKLGEPLEIAIYSAFNFEEQFLFPVKKYIYGQAQLAVSKIYISKKKKEPITISFIYFNFKHCPLFGIFVGGNPQIELIKCKNVDLELY